MVCTKCDYTFCWQCGESYYDGHLRERHPTKPRFVPEELHFAQPLDYIQIPGKKFSPIPRIELNTTRLFQVRVDVSLVSCPTNTVVPNAVCKTDDPLTITMDALTFTNIKLATSIPNARGDYKLRISIGGTITESSHFLLQQQL
jgi:hypothetical protein